MEPVPGRWWPALATAELWWVTAKRWSQMHVGSRPWAKPRNPSKPWCLFCPGDGNTYLYRVFFQYLPPLLAPGAPLSLGGHMSYMGHPTGHREWPRTEPQMQVRQLRVFLQNFLLVDRWRKLMMETKVAFFVCEELSM